MASFDSSNYEEFGNHSKRTKEVFVKLEDPRTGQKSTIVLPGNGYIPRTGSTFDNGIVRGTVIRSWEA